MRPELQPVTLLLKQLREGDQAAFEALIPLVYEQLRKQAAQCLSSERRDHTLPATALVHEAYLRLVEQSKPDWRDVPPQL